MRTIAIENILLANEVYDDLLYKKGKLLLSMGHFQEAKQSFLVLQNAAGEGMWKEEGYFYFAKAAFELDPEFFERGTHGVSDSLSKWLLY